MSASNTVRKAQIAQSFIALTAQIKALKQASVSGIQPLTRQSQKDGPLVEIRPGFSAEDVRDSLGSDLAILDRLVAVLDPVQEPAQAEQEA